MNTFETKYKQQIAYINQLYANTTLIEVSYELLDSEYNGDVLLFIERNNIPDANVITHNSIDRVIKIRYWDESNTKINNIEDIL